MNINKVLAKRVASAILNCLDKNSLNLLSRITNLNEEYLARNINVGKVGNTIRLSNKKNVEKILKYYATPGDKIPDVFDSCNIFVDSVLSVHMPVPQEIGLSSVNRMNRITTKAPRDLKLLRYLRKLNKTLNCGSLVYTAVLALGDTTKDVRIKDCITLLIRNPLVLNSGGSVEDAVLDITLSKYRKSDDFVPLSFSDLFYNTGVNRTHEEILSETGIRKDPGKWNKTDPNTIDASTPFNPFVTNCDGLLSKTTKILFKDNVIQFDKVRPDGILPILYVSLLYSPSGTGNLSVYLNNTAYSGTKGKRNGYALKGYSKRVSGEEAYYSDVVSIDEAEAELLNIVSDAYLILGGKRRTKEYNQHLKNILGTMSSSRHKIAVGAAITNKEKEALLAELLATQVQTTPEEPQIFKVAYGNIPPTVVQADEDEAADDFNQDIAEHEYHGH